MKPKIRIWTEAYSPFILGGDVNQPISAEIDDYLECDLGRGYKGYVVVTPGGKTVIIDAISGGIIGNELTQVRRDVKEADETFLKKQLPEMKKRGQYARGVSVKEFWRRYEKAG